MKPRILIIIAIFAVLSTSLLLACAARSEDHSTAAIEPGEAPAPFPTQSIFGGNATRNSMGVTGPAGPAGPEGAPGAIDMTEPAMADAEESKAMMGEGSADDGAAKSTLQTAERMVISNASLSIEVELVDAALDQVRTIAESAGGFVEHLSSFGNEESQQANVTIRVPQDEFLNTVERLEELGDVQNRNLGSEDVSEQYIDLDARLKSALREEESLLSLLEKATQVNEILTIERELARVRSEIERLQGQLNFLERRVDLATISVALFMPGQSLPEPPAASMVIAEEKVSARVGDVKNLVASLGGEMDRVFLSTRDGKERADLSFRVFPKDFDQAMSALESQGEIISRDVREGKVPAEGAEAPEEPNARIDVTFMEPESSPVRLVLYIGVPIVTVLVLIGLAVSFYLTYQAGRNRRDRFINT